MMAGRLDLKERFTTYDIAECDEALNEDSHWIRFGVWIDRFHDLSQGTVIRGSGQWVGPPCGRWGQHSCAHIFMWSRSRVLLGPDLVGAYAGGLTTFPCFFNASRSGAIV